MIKRWQKKKKRLTQTDDEDIKKKRIENKTRDLESERSVTREVINVHKEKLRRSSFL